MFIIKRNTFSWAAARQKELINSIVTGKLQLDEICDTIRQYKIDFTKHSFQPNELAITQRIGKEEYSGDSLVGRLSKLITDRTGVNPIGTEIQYIIFASEPKLRGCLLEDFTGRFSRYHYWERLSRPLFDKVLNLLRPNENIDFYTLFE